MGNGFADFQHEVMEDKDGVGSVVFAVCVSVLAEENVFVSLHNLDAQ